MEAGFPPDQYWTKIACRTRMVILTNVVLTFYYFYNNFWKTTIDFGMASLNMIQFSRPILAFYNGQKSKNGCANIGPRMVVKINLLTNNFTQRKIEITKSGLITGISVKKFYVQFCPTDISISRRV